MRTLLVGMLTLLAASTVACSNESGASGDNGPDDNQEEQALSGGVTKVGTKLQDPNYLTSYGANVYYATTYGFATQEEAEYHHDIWVKSGTKAAKRLYKNQYGAVWGLTATKNGLYEVSEGYASVMRYALDGTTKDPQSLYHAIYGNDEMPNVGINALSADDDGVAITVRKEDGDDAKGTIVAFKPDGSGQKELGTVPHVAGAIAINAQKIYAGLTDGTVYVGDRAAAGTFTKLAAGEGSVRSIALSGDDVYFGTEKGLYVKHATGAAQQVVAGQIVSLAIASGKVVYAEWGKGTSSIPLAGGTPKMLAKSTSPSSVLVSNGALFITDDAHNNCHDTDEGYACSFDGSVFRVAF